MKHGTRSGYHQHLKRKQPACAACREANRQHSSDQYRKHHPPPYTLKRRILDTIETNQPCSHIELTALIPDANPETIRRTVYRLLAEQRIDGTIQTLRSTQ
jgi:hypothetical protein